MRTNLLLTIVFLALGVLSFLKWAGANRFEDIDSTPMLFEGFTSENIAQILIERPEKEGALTQEGEAKKEVLAFVKQDGKWLLAGPGDPFNGIEAPASDIEMRILDKLKSIRLTPSAFVVDNPDELTLKNFGLDEEAGTRIRCTDSAAAVVADLIVGKNASEGNIGSKEAVTGTYIRRPDLDEVILYEEEIPIDMDSKSWINKTMRDIPEEEILEVKLLNGKGEIHFKREEGKAWTCENSPGDVGELKEYEVTALVGASMHVTASQIEARFNGALMAEYGLDTKKPTVLVTLKTKDGKEHELLIGKRLSGKQEYYAIVMPDPQLVFTLAEWEVTRFEKAPKDFFDPEPEDPEKGGEEPGKEGEKVEAERPPAGEPSKEGAGGAGAPEGGGDPSKERTPAKPPGPGKEAPASPPAGTEEAKPGPGRSPTPFDARTVEELAFPGDVAEPEKIRILASLDKIFAGGRDSVEARSHLVKQGRKAFPAIVNRLRTVDYMAREESLAAFKLHKILEEVTLGRKAGYVPPEEGKEPEKEVAWWNAGTLKEWAILWNNLGKGDPVRWEAYIASRKKGK